MNSALENIEQCQSTVFSLVVSHSLQLDDNTPAPSPEGQET